MDKKLCGIEEISVYLDVSIPYIRKLVRTTTIPFYRIGNRLKFDKSEIDKWLETHKERDEKKLLSVFYDI